MRREWGLLGRLAGADTVVQLAGYYETGQESVLLTEYIQGGELFQVAQSPKYVTSTFFGFSQK